MNSTTRATDAAWLLVFGAWLVATASTLGALFFSEIMELPPCLLCWYQRIFMFPLVLLLPVGPMHARSSVRRGPDRVARIHHDPVPCRRCLHFHRRSALHRSFPDIRMNRKTVFIVAAVLLLAAFALIALFYKSDTALRSDAQGKLELLVRSHASTVGPPEAKVHIVEFLDPACEACRAFYPFVKQLMAANPGKIKLTVRHVAFHEGADFAVQVLEASKKQDKYWPTLERLLASQPRWAINHKVVPQLVWAQLAGLGLDPERLQRDMKDPEIGRNMGQDEADAKKLRVQKTPEYFVNGRQMTTFGQEQLRQLVQEELARVYQ
jgi:protein-disulfide isomerase